MPDIKKVLIYSDGACQGNPGPGGWAAVLMYKGQTKEISGGELATTNNRMELRGAIEALNALREKCEVEFYTDSKYVQDGITSWIKGWKARGWKTKDKSPVKNEDLWRALDEATGKHQVTWKWVRGHSGQEHNERCDVLAVEAIDKLRKLHTGEQLKAALKQFVEDQEQLADRAAAPLIAPLLAVKPAQIQQS